MNSNLNETQKASFELETDEVALKKARKAVYKNLLLVSFSWLFLFTAYTSIANLQSSLNTVDGLGTVSLSVLYASLIVSCIILPTITIKKLGVKWAIFFSQLCYIFYIASNVYPQYYTLIPSAIILGAGAAPLWTAKSTFLTDMGIYYSKYTGESSEVVINRFFGIFFALFQTSSIWGNIISSTVLKPELVENSTFVQDFSKCGINDCPGSDNIETKKPILSTVYLLCGIYVGCALFASAIIFFFVDTYKKMNLVSYSKTNLSTVDLLINTFKHLKNKYQLLILPLTMWSGFEQAFLSADFSKSFITCNLGINYVGLVLICYGVADTIGSYGFGYVIKFVGRVPCFIFAAALNYTCIIIMILWKPNEENTYVLYIVAVLWGLGDAVWQTQINAFYGYIFQENQEAAFSNYRLWESLGFVIAFAYSNLICVRIKVYLLIFYLTIGMIGYIIIEIILRKQKQSAVKPN